MVANVSRTTSSVTTASVASLSKMPDSVKYPIPKYIGPTLPRDKEAEDDSDASDSEDLAHIALAHHLDGLPLNAVEEKYFGPSR